MRLANFEYRSLPALDDAVIEVTVKAGDSLDKIARAHGSTVAMVKALNPKATVLHPGQKLQVKKAVTTQVITSWRPITTHNIAVRYNGGGDPNYEKKLDYALALVIKGKAALCTQ